MSSKLIFSYEEDVMLVELVSNHPCLFDLKHQAYKDIQIREKVWKEISIHLKKSTEDCKKRWRSIKDTYNKKKRNRKLGTGSAKDKPSKWMLADVLSFLDTTTYERQGLSNVISNEHQNATQNDDTSSQVHDSPVDDSISSQIESDYEHLPSTSFSEPTEVIAKKAKVSLTTKRLKQNEIIIDTLNKRSDERNRLLEKLYETNERDPIDIFFESIAATVKQFTSELKIKAKTDVFRIVSELEVQNIQPKCQSSSSSSTYIFPQTVISSPRDIQSLHSYTSSLQSNSTSSSFDIDSSAVNWTQPLTQHYEDTNN
ncbi:hypothetical protein AGLY_018193 [Aphis glycines]|uniref:MADF domain-containing protein n=1 Tax=Aphis glycines TaxID=307491 RepID=A0A6G0SUI6_APHGL|nr:hypothetical protein AGLY_018193 [Aphis glycines]